MTRNVMIWAATAMLLAVVQPSMSADQTSGSTFKDCDTCPEMVALPKGTATLGSEPWEQGRLPFEGAIRQVKIDYQLAVAKTEVTRAQFGEFIKATGYVPVDNSKCNSWNPTGFLGYVHWHTWENPGFYQEETHPVICVSWRDATAFTAWLSKKTGRTYRLLSSAEFEYALRGGTRGPWFWGTSSTDACAYANVADLTFRRFYQFDAPFDCDDKYMNTSPVGIFIPNPFGLHDMLGNAWEWTDDCGRENVANPPTDGSAWTEGGNCKQRVVRSGSWVTGTGAVRAAAQYYLGDDYHSQIAGFRVATVLK